MSGPLRTASWRDVSPGAWTDLVASSPDGWMWHSLEYQEALGGWYNRENMSLGVLAGERLVGLLPLQLVHLTQARVLRYRQLHSQGGLAVAAELTGDEHAAVVAAAADALFALARERRVAEVVLTSTPVVPARQGDHAPANPHVALGLEPLVGHSWVSDLRGSADELWTRLQGRSRTAIRKAEKAGVTVRRAGDGDLETYYELHRQTYTRTGARPHDRAYFERIWVDFVEPGRSVVFVAELNGTTLAAQNVAVAKQAAVYWTGASSQEALRLGANNLVQWTAMRELAAEGVAWFEHGEAFPEGQGKLKGLNDFKKSFGGALWEVPGGRLELGSTAHRVASRALRAADPLLRRLAAKRG